MLSAVFRVIGVVLLMFPTVLGFGYYVVATAARETVLEPDRLISALNENDAYERIYDEFLLSDEFDDVVRDLAGGFEITDEERASLVRQIIGPDQIRTVTEDGILSIADFLTDQRDDLGFLLDLGPSIDRIKPAVLDLLEGRVDSATPAPTTGPQALQDDLESFFTAIGDGALPSQYPDLGGVDDDVRVAAYVRALESLAASGALTTMASEALDAREDEIAGHLESGRIEDGLKVMVRAIAEPVIDAGIAELRTELDADDRLDLLVRVAESEQTREQLEEDARSLRLWINIALGPARWLALLGVVAGTIAIGAVCLPHKRHLAFWPGITLIVAGLPVVILGWVLTLGIPTSVYTSCNENIEAGCGLGLDVIATLAKDVGGDFIWPSVVILAIGASAILASTVLAGHPIDFWKAEGDSEADE